MRTAPRVAIIACVWWAAGCASGGQGLKYTVDDAILQPLPAGDQQGALDARKETEMAVAERETANRALHEVADQTNAAMREKDHAQLEAEKVVSEQEGGRASGDQNQAEVATHHKEVADLGVKVAKLKLEWLHQKREWLEHTRAAAEAHLEAARARFELEKAKVSQDRGIKPRPDFAPADYEEQWKDRDARWVEKKQAAAAEEKDALEKQAKWQEQDQQFRRLQGT